MVKVPKVGGTGATAAGVGAAAVAGGLMSAFRSRLGSLDDSPADAKKATRSSGGTMSVEPTISGLAKGIERSNQLLGQVASAVAISNDLLATQVKHQSNTNKILLGIADNLGKGGGGSGIAETAGLAAGIASLLPALKLVGRLAGPLGLAIAAFEAFRQGPRSKEEQTETKKAMRDSAASNIRRAGDTSRNEAMKLIQEEMKKRNLSSRDVTYDKLKRIITVKKTGEKIDIGSRISNDPARSLVRNIDPVADSLGIGAPTTTSSSSQRARAPAITSRKLGFAELVSLAKGAGFNQQESVTMAAIAMAESSGRSDAHNPNASTGDNSYGLWQINMIGRLGPARRREFGINANEQLFDPRVNAKAAYRVYRQQGFNAWSVYKSGTYQRFMGGATANAGVAPTFISNAAPASTSSAGGSVTTPQAALSGILGAAGINMSNMSTPSIASTPSGIMGGGAMSYTNTQSAPGGGAGVGTATGTDSGSVMQLQGKAAGTRRGTLSQRLVSILQQAANAAGVTVKVYSGGQRMPGAPGAVGSHRHDQGNAADLDLFVGGRRLSANNPQDRAIMAKFVATAVSLGATGVGHGNGYMGPSRIHVGFGKAAVWGGSQWIREAWAAGRKGQTNIGNTADARTAGTGTGAGAGSANMPARGSTETGGGTLPGALQNILRATGMSPGGASGVGRGTTGSVGAGGSGITKADVTASWEKYNESGNPADMIRADALMKQWQAKGGDRTPQREAAKRVSTKRGRSGGRTGGMPLPPVRPDFEGVNEPGGLDAESLSKYGLREKSPFERLDMRGVLKTAEKDPSALDYFDFDSEMAKDAKRAAIEKARKEAPKQKGTPAQLAENNNVTARTTGRAKRADAIAAMEDARMARAVQAQLPPPELPGKLPGVLTNESLAKIETGQDTNVGSAQVSPYEMMPKAPPKIPPEQPRPVIQNLPNPGIMDRNLIDQKQLPGSEQSVKPQTSLPFSIDIAPSIARGMSNVPPNEGDLSSSFSLTVGKNN